MIIHRGLDRVLANLGKAISGKHVAIFHNNASACAGVYKDFTVEPFKMDINSVNVAALDLRSGRNKIFKVARIGGGWKCCRRYGPGRKSTSIRNWMCSA